MTDADAKAQQPADLSDAELEELFERCCRARSGVLMFNRGIDALLEALPSLSNLSPAQVRRLLTLAWIETTDLRWDDTGQNDDPEAARLSGIANIVGDLRRLATALEVHATLPAGVERATVRACAFVAAEALAIANDLAPDDELRQLPWLFGSLQRFERVESGLLYLIAGYDSNAALSGSDPADPDQTGNDPEAAIAGWAFTRAAYLEPDHWRGTRGCPARRLIPQIFGAAGALEENRHQCRGTCALADVR